jgi:carbamoyl-phosphate synthase small subunit
MVAISDIDTRALTRHLREKGALKGCIITGEDADEATAVAKAQNTTSPTVLPLAPIDFPLKI